MTIIFNVHSNGKHSNVLTNPPLLLVSIIPVNRSGCSIVTSMAIHLLCGLVFEKPYPRQQRSQLLLSDTFFFCLFCLFVCLFVSVNQKTPLDVDLYFVAGKLRYQLDFKLASLTRHTTKYCVGHLLKNAKVNEFFTFSIALFTILEPFCKPNC